MKRLFAIVLLACVLAQTPLSFAGTKKAEAAVLRNVIPTNIKIPNPLSEPQLTQAAAYLADLNINSTQDEDVDDVIEDILTNPKIRFLPLGNPGYNKAESISFYADYYPALDSGSLGDGFLSLVPGTKGMTDTAGVVQVSIDVANMNEVAEPNDLEQVIGDRDESESSTHGIYIGIAKSKVAIETDFHKIIGKIPQDLEKLGFTQTYVPEFLNSKTNFTVPGATKEASYFAFTGAKYINIKKYLFRQPQNIKNKTSVSFEVPIADLEPNTKYYAQIVISEEDFERNTYSKIIELPITLKAGEKNPNYQDGVPIEEQLSDVQGSINQEAQEDVEANIFGELLTCSWRKPLSWFKGCMVLAFHSIIYRASAGLVELSAKLMDMFIGFSISSFFYSDKIEFIDQGWHIVRDVSNILFIFILLWTALNIILRVNHHFNANKVIAQIIVIGVLINFSLFFTRVIIDAGNIFAKVFYNAITVVGDDDLSKVASAQQSEDNKFQIKSLSGGIADGMNLARIISDEKITKALTGETGLVFMILVLGTIMNIMAALIFFKSGFYFVGRIISLWFAMVFSPFALTSTTLHSLEHFPKFGFSQWMKNLTSASFGAGIFMFFIFLILKFIGSGFLSGISENIGSVSGWTVLAIIFLEFLFIIGLMQAAKEIAKNMAGEFGGALAGAVEGATKFVGGAALGLGAGALAFGARNTVGRGMEALKDTRLGKWAENSASNKGLSGWMARRTMDFQKYGKEGSFDARKTMLGNQFSQATGINLDSGARIPGLGFASTEATSGGRKGVETRKAMKEQKLAEKYGKDMHHEKEEIENKIEEQKGKINAKEAEINDLKLQAAQAKAAGNTQQENQLKVDIAREQGALSTLRNGVTELKNANGQITRQAVTGLAQLEEALKRNEKAGVREFLWQRMKKSSPYQFKKDAQGNDIVEKRDDFGQIVKFGKFDETKTRARNLGRAFAESFRSGARAGGGAGLLAGMLAGPAGAIVGTIGGALSGGVLNGLRGMLNETAFRTESAIYKATKKASDFGHPLHAPKNTYKGPANNFFSNLFAGSGGGSNNHGGGHDHGHDDHGGGGHH